MVKVMAVVVVVFVVVAIEYTMHTLPYVEKLNQQMEDMLYASKKATK